MNEMIDRQGIARWLRVKLSAVDGVIVPKLRGYRIGRRVLFRRADVLQWFFDGMTKVKVSG